MAHVLRDPKCKLFLRMRMDEPRNNVFRDVNEVQTYTYYTA
jgi:hypothetical protein